MLEGNRQIIGGKSLIKRRKKGDNELCPFEWCFPLEFLGLMQRFSRGEVKWKRFWRKSATGSNFICGGQGHVRGGKKVCEATEKLWAGSRGKRRIKHYSRKKKEIQRRNPVILQNGAGSSRRKEPSVARQRKRMQKRMETWSRRKPWVLTSHRRFS